MTKGIMKVPFVNDGEGFEVPIIRVSDIREMQLKRSQVEDPDFKELEASVSLAYSMLNRIDKTVKLNDVENWEYSEFVKFIKLLWETNAENFRGILPNLPATMSVKK